MGMCTLLLTTSPVSRSNVREMFMNNLPFIKIGFHIPYFETHTNFSKRLKVTQLCCECDPVANPTSDESWSEKDWRTQFLGTDAFLHHDQHHSRPEDVGRSKEWHNIVEEFTSRAISYESDRLPAISGLAGLTQAGLHDEYICSIWRKDLVRGLLWNVPRSTTHSLLNRSLRHEKYYAPSWTWASITGALSYDYRASGGSTYVEDLEVIHVSYALASTNPFGPVTHASIVARGFLIPVCVQRPRESSGTHFSIHFSAGISRSQDQHVFLRDLAVDVFGENAAHFEVALDEQLFLVPVLRSSNSIMEAGIVVRIVQNETDVYQRVGAALTPPGFTKGFTVFNSFSELAFGLWYDTAQQQEFTII
jgi:hypothetical protein